MSWGCSNEGSMPVHWIRFEDDSENFMTDLSLYSSGGVDMQSFCLQASLLLALSMRLFAEGENEIQFSAAQYPGVPDPKAPAYAFYTVALADLRIFVKVYVFGWLGDCSMLRDCMMIFSFVQCQEKLQVGYRFYEAQHLQFKTGPAPSCAHASVMQHVAPLLMAVAL